MNAKQRFEEWYTIYGTMDDLPRNIESWMYDRIKTISYRAYRRGCKDVQERKFKEKGI